MKFDQTGTLDPPSPVEPRRLARGRRQKVRMSAQIRVDIYYRSEQVHTCNHLDVITGEADAHHEASNASEPVNSDLDLLTGSGGCGDRQGGQGTRLSSLRMTVGQRVQLQTPARRSRFLGHRSPGISATAALTMAVSFRADILRERGIKVSCWDDAPISVLLCKCSETTHDEP